MNKTTFVNIVNLLLEQAERDEALDKALRAYSPDSDFFPIPIRTKLLQLLEKTFHDTNGTIYWAIFEQEFGKNGDVNIYNCIDNTIIATLNSPEALYDYLTSM